MDQNDSVAALNRALARKAEAEAILLEAQRAPPQRRLEILKAVAGASGIILALVSLIGGAGSVVGWLANQSRDREQRIEERLERTLTLLSSERPAQRAAAIGSLSSFLAPKESGRNTRVTVAVANALALEDDQVVRGALVAFFQNLDAGQIDQVAASRALAALAANNRALMADAAERDINDSFSAPDERPARDRLLALTAAMAELLRKKARAANMSGVYLSRVDLSGLDLAGTNFDDANLDFTVFDDGVLRGSSFNAASLVGSSFVSADLRDARFTLKDNNPSRRNASFLQEALALRGQAGLPDFHCADLRNADFSGFRLIDLTSDAERDAAPANGSVYFVYGGRFAKANLDGANFRNVAGYAVVGKARSPGWILDTFIALPGAEGNRDAAAYEPDPDARHGPPPAGYGVALDLVAEQFAGAKIDKARLPGWLAGHVRPGLAAPKDVKCKPRAPW